MSRVDHEILVLSLTTVESKLKAALLTLLEKGFYIVRMDIIGKNAVYIFKKEGVDN